MSAGLVVQNVPLYLQSSAQETDVSVVHKALSLVCKVMVKGQGQIYGAQRSILWARFFRVQPRAIRVITSLRCLYVCNQGVYMGNSADAVDRLLIKLMMFRFNNNSLCIVHHFWCNNFTPWHGRGFSTCHVYL